MKKLTLFAVILILGAFIGTSFAVEVALFGPNQYTRTTGKPNAYTETFPGIVGHGKLILTNGTQDGKNRVSSALIIINGKQILGPHDFNQQVYDIEVPVKLTENNSISVELRSKPGSYINVQVKEEVQADSVAVIGPQGGVIQTNQGDSVYIPQGAINHAIVFTLTKLPIESLPAGLPDQVIPLGALEILPDGISFNVPISVKIKLNDAIQEGTYIPILAYSPPLGGYVFESWDGIIDDQGFLVSNKVTHLSMLIAWKTFFGSQNEPTYKQQISSILSNFLNQKNGNFCSYRNNFFSLGDIVKLEEYINREDLRIWICPSWLCPLILGNSIALYIPGSFSWVGPPLYKTMVLPDTPETLVSQKGIDEAARILYHELMHYIFDIRKSYFDFANTGYVLTKAGEENLTWYMENVSLEAWYGNLETIERELSNPVCNLKRYSDNLNIFYTFAQYYLECNPKGSNRPPDGDDQIIPLALLSILKQLLGFDVDPGKIKAGYENGVCGTCSAPPPLSSPWPMFQHDPGRSGQSDYLGPISAPTVDLIYAEGSNFQDPTYNPLYTSPVIDHNGIIYSSVVFPASKAGILALNPDGSKKWFQQTPIDQSLALQEDGSILPDDTIPRDKEGNTYLSEMNILRAIDNEGNEKWRREFQLENPYGCPSRDPSVIPPAIGKNGIIYVVVRSNSCNFDQDPVDYLYLINSENQILKIVNLGGYRSTSPSISSNGTAYIFNLFFPRYGWQPTLYLMAISSSGEFLWAKTFNLYNPPPPVIDVQENIYFPIGKSVCALDKNGNELWPAVYLTDVPSAWEIAEIGMALGKDGTLYLSGRGATVAIR